MIGQGVLNECLVNDAVEAVLVINRYEVKRSHSKLMQIVLANLNELSDIAFELRTYNTCFFCLGVSSTALSNADYYKITYELTKLVADTLLAVSENFTFCYISGAGTDSSEKGRMFWARVKGKTENALLQMPFKKVYMFRPAFIQPMNGIMSRTKSYNIMYSVFKPFYFLLKHFKGVVTDTETLGKAMIYAVSKGYDKNILENRDINIIGNEIK